MAVRGDNSIVTQVRDILQAIDELNTTQPVGSSQIVAKPYETGAAYDRQFSITAPFQSVGSSVKAIRIDVEPTDMPEGNILLSDIVPELRYTNGVRVSNWNAAGQYIELDTFYFLVLIDSAQDDQNSYILGIVAPTNTVMRLKVHITANATVGFTLTELN